MSNSIIEAQQTFEEERQKEKIRIWKPIKKDVHFKTFPQIKRIDLLAYKTGEQKIFYPKVSLKDKIISWIIKQLFKLKTPSGMEFKPKKLAKFINIGKNV